MTRPVQTNDSAKRATRRSVAVLLVVTATMGVGCVGPRTAVRIPDCVERIEVTGEHHRASESELVFSHGLDLPLSRTEITVERPDGTRETTTLLNTHPDLLRLLGAGIVGMLSAGAVGLYAYQVGLNNEQFFLGPTFWALPLGGAGFLLATSIAMTGWHPGGDTDVIARCSEAD